MSFAIVKPLVCAMAETTRLDAIVTGGGLLINVEVQWWHIWMTNACLHSRCQATVSLYAVVAKKEGRLLSAPSFPVWV
jgi:hypothetical protein